MPQTPVKIGLVDDHILIRDALANTIKSFDEYDVSLLAENGKDFIEKLNHTNIPEILLLDLNMPEMNGQQTAQSIKDTINRNTPLILLCLSGQENLCRFYQK